jgi:hypothetical protein
MKTRILSLCDSLSGLGKIATMDDTSDLHAGDTLYLYDQFYTVTRVLDGQHLRIDRWSGQPDPVSPSCACVSSVPHPPDALSLLLY